MTVERAGTSFCRCTRAFRSLSRAARSKPVQGSSRSSSRGRDINARAMRTRPRSPGRGWATTDRSDPPCPWRTQCAGGASSPRGGGGRGEGGVDWQLAGQRARSEVLLRTGNIGQRVPAGNLNRDHAVASPAEYLFCTPRQFAGAAVKWARLGGSRRGGDVALIGGRGGGDDSGAQLGDPTRRWCTSATQCWPRSRILICLVWVNPAIIPSREASRPIPLCL